jgi:protein-disulfide isomerase
MKKITLFLAALLVCASASAAPAADITTIRAYAKRALPKCPDAIMTVEPFAQSGPLPMNFVVYDVNIKSTDENCSTRKYLLYSPITQQVLIGTVIALPADGRSAKARIEDQASNMLKEHIIVDVGAFPLPDGLKSVSMTKSTAYGPFAYHGFLDASERFLIVGSRGNLRTDAGTTLREALGVANAVRRGNKDAKIEIIELSDFECPTCGREHKVVEPIIEKNLSKVDYKRLDLPLYEHHEWAMFAALGAHAIQKVAPAKYWDYANFVFANQETIGKQSFDKTLKNYCEDHDIPWAKVDPIYRSNSERQALLDQVSRAFDTGINSTPTYILNGQVLGFGKEGAFMIGEIKKALGVK